MATPCRHHWLLSQPRDDIIVGRCKLCTQERWFPARLEDTERSTDYLDLWEGARRREALAS